ncbi:MAG: glycosyltransferase family 2 protein [Flavobacteriaceae bacterium]|nr:glycosyltransferase family 2 protein [Flavobacteriaceae bacterium]
MLKVAVVILNWNGKKLLEQFLPSMIAFSKNDADVYVADNNSSDDSITFLKEKYPEVKIVQNPTNGGYAKGYNDALKHIDADIYALVNSDIEVTENWIQPIVTEFSNSENTAVVQPKILDFKDNTRFEYAGAAGGFIDFFGYPYCRGRIFQTLEPDKHQYDNAVNIFWASGACFFIRSQVFHQLKGFDEDYFAHQEEIDLCWRVENEGYKIRYVGDATVYHVGGATLHEAHPRKTFLNFRNSLFSIIKNVPKRYLVPVVLMRLLLDGLAGIKFLTELRPAHTWAIIKAHFSFYLMLPKMMGKRKNISYKRKNYHHSKSIIWQYYVKGRKTFDKILGEYI